MQVFIIGKSKAGKSTLAKKVLEILPNACLYEAGSWTREEFKVFDNSQYDEMSELFRDKLTKFALDKLKANPNYSFEKFNDWNNLHKDIKHKIIIGVRNPDDFIQMTLQDKNNKVIFIDGKGKTSTTTDLFEEGLEVIKKYVLWKNNLGQNYSLLNIGISESYNLGDFLNE